MPRNFQLLENVKVITNFTIKSLQTKIMNIISVFSITW